VAGRKKTSPLSRRIWKTMELTTIFLVCACVSFSGFSYPFWKHIQKETIRMAEVHMKHDTAHMGWSFPGSIWSAPASLNLPRERRIAHARLRGYEEQCPPTSPGQFCGESGAIIPRGGVFPEGVQPPGTEPYDWTRPLAMEPVLLSLLIGPDGELRKHLPLDQAPRGLVEAILASEDSDFHSHVGVNPKAMIRAVLANLQGGSYMQGGSTLTMQVARNLSQKKEKTLRRKVQEMATAVFLDEHLGKKGVLQVYLDAPYLGQSGSFSICGFAAAAEHYWGKDVRTLGLDEIATLVGILPAPGHFRPDLHPGRALERRNRVLYLMAKGGWDINEIEDAASRPIILDMQPLPESLHPAYVQATLSWLRSRMADMRIYGTGLQVFTAMDVVVQNRTEQALERELRFLEKSANLGGEPPLEAAATVISPTNGQLVAVYGGTQASSTDFSRATQAKRQAGSSFKPLVYALAFSLLDDGGNPLWRSFDTLPNKRRTFPDTDGWRPRNNGGKYSETSTLAAGMAFSQNIATASLLEKLGGPQSLIDFAADFGIQTQNFPKEMGLALGQAEVTPFEMTRFVATIANGGMQATGQPVVSAVDLAGREMVQAKGLESRTISEEAAALTRELMRLVVLNGTGGASRGAAGRNGYKGEAIGKTGTTDQSKDVWFVGSTPTYSSALWIGYDQPKNIRASSSDFAAPLWGWWMKELHEDLDKNEGFEGLALKKKWGCHETGLIANDTCSTIPLPVLAGQRLTGTCKVEHPAPEETPKYEGLWRRLAREEKEKEARRASPKKGGKTKDTVAPAYPGGIPPAPFPAAGPRP
jgi:penicillin-binding protein 1B